jgi:hypothetical protein
MERSTIRGWWIFVRGVVFVCFTLIFIKCLMLENNLEKDFFASIWGVGAFVSLFSFVLQIRKRE